MHMWKLWALPLLAGAMMIPAAAQKADFNGTWKLNLEKSFLAGDHPAKDYELTTVIEQKESAIKRTETAVHVSMMNIPLPDSKTTVEFIVDGKERDAPEKSPYPGMPPLPTKVSAEWQGSTLLVTESSQLMGNATATRCRYFLSDNGSELIELLEGHTGFGDTEQRLIFDKQP
jgi:hypothetical protein